MKTLVERLKNLADQENLTIHLTSKLIEDRFELGGNSWTVYLNEEHPSTLKFDKVKRIVNELEKLHMIII